MPGKVPTGVKPSEFWVMEAVMDDVEPVKMMEGVAVTPSTIQGFESTFADPLPLTESQPNEPGPALQPHQLFSASTLPAPLQTKPPELLTKLLK